MSHTAKQGPSLPVSAAIAFWAETRSQRRDSFTATPIVVPVTARRHRPARGAVSGTAVEFGRVELRPWSLPFGGQGRVSWPVSAAVARSGVVSAGARFLGPDSFTVTPIVVPVTARQHRPAGGDQ